MRGGKALVDRMRGQGQRSGIAAKRPWREGVMGGEMGAPGELEMKGGETHEEGEHAEKPKIEGGVAQGRGARRGARDGERWRGGRASNVLR